MPIRRGFFEDFAAAEKPGTLGSQAICATPWDSNPSRKNEIEVLRRPVELTINCGLMHRSKLRDYSITSSAVVSRAGGMVRPRVFAVFKFITSSNFVGCRTGKSAGLAPLRILPV